MRWLPSGSTSGRVLAVLWLPVCASCSSSSADETVVPVDAGADQSSPTDGSTEDGGCSQCNGPCDLDGDGHENGGEGCAGDDCDDSHPNCWDAATHGCCSGDGLLFHSEFEGSVTVEHPDPTSQWRLPFAGLDDVTGYDWSSGFPEDEAFPHLNVLCLVNGTSELVGSDPAQIDDPLGNQFGTTGFVDALVVDHPGIDGQGDNKALFYHSWRDDPNMGSNSRLQANWIPPQSMRSEGGEIYVAHWLKVQPNLYEVHTAYADESDWHSRWRSLMEWRHDQAGCADADFRFSLFMETYGSDYVFWHVGARDLWDLDTRDRPDLTPPVDRWFFLEVYTLRHPTEGRVWVGVNGMTLFDAQGVQTMPSTSGCYDGGLYYQFLKLYGDLYNYEGRIDRELPPYQFWQYYDGLRIHDRLPAGHCAIDSSCPPASDLR